MCLHGDYEQAIPLSLIQGETTSGGWISDKSTVIRRKNTMLKIRLKRLGAKKNPSYRIIVINSTTKREGRPIQELGHYNPKTKVMKFDVETAKEWVKKGAQPTETVAYLMKNCNADGTLNYKKKETVKLSKKAQAKKAAEAEAKAAAEAEAKAEAEAAATAPAEEPAAEEAPAEEAAPEA